MTIPGLGSAPANGGDTSVRQWLADKTIIEISGLLKQVQPHIKLRRPTRERILSLAEEFNAEEQQRLFELATANPGSKRRRVVDSERAAPRKRPRLIEPFDPLTQEQPHCVHVGTVDDLIEGPFLRTVSERTRQSCIIRTIERTGNQALKKGTCMVCARRMFVVDLMPCTPAEIPNIALLEPTHPHPAHTLFQGGLLHETAFQDQLQRYVCSQCNNRLVAHQRPALSLANNMWVGKVPFVLDVLNLPERLLIALYFPAAYVVKLFPKKAGGRHWDKEKINSGLRGNVSTYRLNNTEIAEMLTGKLMPRPVAILAAVVSVTFVGVKNAPLMILPDEFEVRRQRVMDALVWLKANNKLYRDIVIDEERLQQLPVVGVPDEIRVNARYSEDESILDREHGGYVPVDGGEENEETEGVDELGEDEEREEIRERVGLAPLVGAGDDEGEDCGYDARVFLLQAHGCVDVAGDGVSDADLFHGATQNLLPANQREYGVRPGGGFVNEYPRERPIEGETHGERTDGGAENANHLLGTFPTLFPYGLGGLEVDRDDNVTYEAHARWALQYADGRFRKDLYFVFQVFGVLLKRQVARSSVLQLKRSTYLANHAAFQNLTVADFLQASQEESRRQAISNPVIQSLRKQLTAVRARVMGTDESRIAIRAQVWGMILRFNPPTIWATINLSDTGDPIAQVLAGQEIDLDKFIATAGPDSEARSRTIAADPYAAAEFFHLFVRVILEEMFGIVVNPRGSIERKIGIMGKINGYVGTVEAQGRGTLHLHILFWLDGAPVAAVMKEALLRESFRTKIKCFLAQNIRAHIQGTDAESLMRLKLEKNIAYSRPEDPRLPNYEARAAVAEARIARAVQTHDCKPWTCQRLKRGRLVCKRRAPWLTATEDWVTESGEWGPKRMYNRINAWNPPLLQVARCNQDMKLVTNGGETKDITFYITLYIAKRQIQASNASALLAKSRVFTEKLNARQEQGAQRNKRMLQRCANTLSRQHKFSAPEVVSYLMGWGDRYISHTYVKIYWDQITAQLRRTFPYLLGLRAGSGMDSTMTVPAEDGETEGLCTLTRDDQGVFVLKDQLKEYQDRGEELESMSFYDYFTLTYDGRIVGQEVDEEDLNHATERGAGRPRSQQFRYRPGTRPNHCRVVRSRRQEINLHFIGRWFPREESGTMEYHAAQMLLLFQPWRTLSGLPNGHLSFRAAFDAFLETASVTQRQIIANIRYFYECSDRASERRAEQEAAENGEADAGAGAGSQAVDTIFTAFEEPTDAEVEKALAERYAARERIFGEGAIAIAKEKGIFLEDYASAAPQPIARKATEDDMAKYNEWGQKVASYTRGMAAEAGGDTSVEDLGGVVVGVAEDYGMEEAGVVDLTPPQNAHVTADSLNTEQRRAHDIIVNHLQDSLLGREREQLLMIVRGQGGTGKTVLLNAISESFKQLDAGRLLAKTATTGVAASLFGGQTLHNWAGIGIKKSTGKPSRATVAKREENILPTRYLVIDEYSMMTKRLLEQLHQVTGAVKEAAGECHAGDSFGNINVILFGDLHQFPPVGSLRQALFYTGPEAEGGSAVGRSLYEQFTTVVTLTEQRRVTDPVWMALLSRLREGACTKKDISLVRSLLVDADGTERAEHGVEEVDWRNEPWSQAVLVTPRHSARILWNAESLRRHSAQSGAAIYACPAEDKVSKSGEELNMWQRLAVAQSKSEAIQKLGEVVSIAVGMRAMVLVNISTEAQLANGTRGEIVDLVLDYREPLPLKVGNDGSFELQYLPAVVLFKPDHGTVPSFEGLTEGVIPIVPSQAKFAVAQANKKGSVTVARRQYAITPGYAFTDYKSQGQTIPYVVIDLGRPPTGKLTPFNAYVALSRSHGKEHIRILRGFDTALFTSHPSDMLRREDDRLAACTVATRNVHP